MPLLHCLVAGLVLATLLAGCGTWQPANFRDPNCDNQMKGGDPMRGPCRTGYLPLRSQALPDGMITTAGSSTRETATRLP